MFSRSLSTTRFSRPSTAPSICRYASSRIPGPNQAIIDMLRTEIENEQTSPTKNRYRLKSFNNVLSIISRLERPIQTMAELESMKGIGKGIARRIGEVWGSSPLPNVGSQTKEESERIKTIQELTTLPSIGSKRAMKLVDAGCRGIKDLNKEKYLSLLTPTQRVYIKYFAHLHEPALLEEAELAAAFIRERLPSSWEVIIVGDLRRGLATNEIRILLVHQETAHVPIPTKSLFELDPKETPKPFHKYIPKRVTETSPLHRTALVSLRGAGFLAAELNVRPRDWQGVVRLPGRDIKSGWDMLQERISGINHTTGSFRRLHLYSAPLKSRGAALIALTGDDDMWKSMRVKAHKLGMYFDEVGLWKWHSNEGQGGDVDGGFWQLLQSSTEEEIFDQLGLEWLKPTRRNFRFIT